MPPTLPMAPPALPSMLPPALSPAGFGQAFDAARAPGASGSGTAQLWLQAVTSGNAPARSSVPMAAARPEEIDIVGVAEGVLDSADCCIELCAGRCCAWHPRVFAALLMLVFCIKVLPRAVEPLPFGRR
jgi:hypothetical protein